ncbi:MAG: hypothetical protein H6R10_726 [Rhodocyclaceae bacterium]|nr:hypothetical protein [Rhodocyclaceae bacterium]
MITTHIPDDMTLVAAAARAASSGFFLVTDGRRTLISPVVPPGFHRIVVRNRPAELPQEITPCAA